MRRRGRADAVVVGAGVVGAACAAGLAQQGLEVVLVEGSPPTPWSPAAPDLRVYAFAHDNARLLGRLGAWDPVLASDAVQPYRRMRVWDAGGGGELVFDADAFGRRELGWILEQALLVDRLWTAVAASRLDVRCPARVESLVQDDEGVELRLDDGSRVAARVAIAADGAGSTLRGLAGIDVDSHDYGQAGVVAYVATERPHEATAWQRFLPGGPLAFLPCADGSSSIVWSLPAAEAGALLALDDAGFGDRLTRAFGGRLGRVDPRSRRVAFPLRRQLARSHLGGRVLLAGDAAHVVHPLAGQGVNLGLRDVDALLSGVADARARGAAWDAPQRLARWARSQRSENAVAAAAFEGINRLFSNDALLPTLLRGQMLGMAGRLPPLAATLWRRAAGT